MISMILWDVAIAVLAVNSGFSVGMIILAGVGLLVGAAFYVFLANDTPLTELLKLDDQLLDGLKCKLTLLSELVELHNKQIDGLKREIALKTEIGWLLQEKADIIEEMILHSYQPEPVDYMPNVVGSHKYRLVVDGDMFVTSAAKTACSRNKWHRSRTRKEKPCKMAHFRDSWKSAYQEGHA